MPLVIVPALIATTCVALLLGTVTLHQLRTFFNPPVAVPYDYFIYPSPGRSTPLPKWEYTKTHEDTEWEVCD